MSAQWETDVQSAFSRDPKLAQRIINVAGTHHGELPALFGSIAQYILSNDQTAETTNSKKRKLDHNASSSATNGAITTAGIADPTVIFECKNVSFQMPARKKLKLEIVCDGKDNSKRELRLLNPSSGSTEHTLANNQIDQAFCLPVPEKQQRQWNFCLLPQPGATTTEGTPCEQMLLTLGETKPDDASAASGPFPEGSTYVSVVGSELNHYLHAVGKAVIMPSEAEFASSIPQAHRKGEKAYHVKAHRGTKEGFLFLLPTGIIFGFKKPLSFFPFSSIESISYTSVLQRTFNLVIAAIEPPNTEAKEIEFSMLDQADFAGIDAYIKRHGLNDASMAAQRKAKAYNVNKDKKEGVVNGDGDDAADGGTEQNGQHEKTEQELQDEEDEEDEEEEDYEASGGESDGEGESSEEEYENGEGVEAAEMEEEEEEEDGGPLLDNDEDED